MHGRPTSSRKGDTEENRKHGELELERRCAEMGVTAGIVLKMEDMARSGWRLLSAAWASLRVTC
ncbi:hypothetical protein OK016_07755 [Vibrio chagasii]|nr:hypothetical protein [Vibrio chagasii]